MVERSCSTLVSYWQRLSRKLSTSPRGRWVFRGLPRSSYELIPKVGRIPHSFSSRQKLETALLDKFERGATAYLEYRPENKWEWLALAQHHGLPTRLLDWTLNPLGVVPLSVES
jgi:hypothetical protein